MNPLVAGLQTLLTAVGMRNDFLDFRDVFTLVHSSTLQRTNDDCCRRGPLENRQWVQRRAGATFDGQWRKGDHELIAPEPPGRFDKALEVEVLHNIDANIFQNHLMDGISLDSLLGSPTRPGKPIDIEVMAEKRRFPLLHPRKRIGIIAGDFVAPGPELCAALPSADV